MACLECGVTHGPGNTNKHCKLASNYSPESVAALAIEEARAAIESILPYPAASKKLREITRYVRLEAETYGQHGQIQADHLLLDLVELQRLLGMR